ncbi:gamma-glutamyltransferase [Undibacterium sp. Ji22W]|uniref:gamma-glutamyltransferase n=1 Tax=Undibacterium sp. Ji22W TaxID=3413038 RepID=UPI003BF1217F
MHCHQYLPRIRKLAVFSLKKVHLALITTLFTVSQIAYSPLTFAQGTGAQIQYDTSYDILSPVRAKNGVVSSEQGLASQVGLDVLKRGGNAVDAAVAVGFALAVVLPHAGNIGGGGFMLIHDAKSGKDIALDFRELAPALAHRDMFLDADGKIVPGSSTSTHLAVGVPGTVAGLDLALRKYGTMSLKDLIAPSIKLAERGFEVTPYLAQLLEASRNQLGKWPSSRAVFFNGERPLRAGEKLIQKDLAHSLRLIAEQGSKAFYEGAIAKKIVAEMKNHGGMITSDDMKNYQPVERTAVTGTYRGYQVVSMPPPSSGGVHVIQMLNMLEHFPLAKLGVNSAQTIHDMTEVMKLAYADRAEYLGDPDFVKVPVAGLTSKKYADELVKKIDSNRATPSAQIKPGKPLPYESDQTTHYSVVDKFGNVVATTYTLNLLFGSGIVATGTGITLNNEMDDFSVKAGLPNAFGLVGGEANAVAAKKRPLSSMTPTMVLKDGKPFLVTGSPGGSRIITTTLQVILNIIDHQLNAAEATITPRIHHQWEPDMIRLERGFNADTLELLKQKGHQFSIGRSIGRTQTIKITPEGFEAFADPRNPDGRALGY